MTAKTSTDAPAPVTTGSDNGAENIEPLKGSTDPLINRFDYAGGMRDYLSGIKSMSDPAANRFLPDTSFAPDSSFQIAQTEAINPNSATDAISVVAQLAGRAERGRAGDRTTRPEQADPLIQQKINELQTRFNITITPPGVFLGNQENLCASPGRDKPKDNPNAPSAIRSRVPTMHELESLDKALQTTGDAALTRDGSPLKVTFTNKPSEGGGRGGRTGGEGAFYLPPKENNGVAELRINPSSRLLDPILPHMLRHEIGHNAEVNAYTDGKHPNEVLEGLGFKSIPNPFYSGAPGEPSTLDAVRVKENGKDSFYLRMPPDCQNPRGDWLRVNENGQLLSQTGRLVPMRDGQPDPRSPIQPFSRPDAFIQNNIAVKHPTRYFDNVNEVITEAFARYSGLDDAGKAKFQNDFPNHYEAVRRMLEAQKLNLGR